MATKMSYKMFVRKHDAMRAQLKHNEAARGEVLAGAALLEAQKERHAETSALKRALKVLARSMPLGAQASAQATLRLLPAPPRSRRRRRRSGKRRWRGGARGRAANARA